MRKHQFTLLALGCALVAGCPIVNPPPPASAVLEGDWTGTTEDNVALVLTFDADGVVVKIVGTPDGGEPVTVDVNNSTTALDGASGIFRPAATDASWSFIVSLSR